MILVTRIIFVVDQLGVLRKPVMWSRVVILLDRKLGWSGCLDPSWFDDGVKVSNTKHPFCAGSTLASCLFRGKTRTSCRCLLTNDHVDVRTYQRKTCCTRVRERAEMVPHMLRATFTSDMSSFTPLLFILWWWSIIFKTNDRHTVFKINVPFIIFIP